MKRLHASLFCSIAAIAIAAVRTINPLGACAQAAAPMTGMAQPKPAAVPSSSLALTVDGRSTTFSMAELAAMPQTTVKVRNANSNADESYSGVLLSVLLAKAGFVADKTTQHKLLRSYIRAEGTDKFWVLYSLTEVEPTEHTGDVIVALSVDGHSLGADGELKLISTDDKKPQRWVRNLSAIALKTVE
jgi:hypothetical protein